MTREEQLACLKDRPCSVCKFHTDRCNRWTCVFEDEPEEQEPCEDCRTCNKWSECECGEKGHKNDTSIGYSIGECKDYEPCEDCTNKEFIEIVVSYPPADLCVYPEYKGKPYYSIKYRENGKEYYTGFGTYKIEILSQWIKEYFMPSIQPKPKPKTDTWSIKEVADALEKHGLRMSEISEIEIKSMTKEQNYMRGYENGKSDVLDKIRAEIHATAELHEDGDYYLRDEWIDEIFDDYKAESEEV